MILGKDELTGLTQKYLCFCKDIKEYISSTGNKYYKVELLGFNGYRRIFMSFTDKQLSKKTFEDKLVITSLYLDDTNTGRIVDIIVPNEQDEQLKKELFGYYSEEEIKNLEDNIVKILKENNINVSGIPADFKYKMLYLFNYKTGETIKSLYTILNILNMTATGQKTEILRTAVSVMRIIMEYESTDKTNSDWFNVLSNSKDNKNFEDIIICLRDYIGDEVVHNYRTLLISNSVRTVIDSFRLNSNYKTLGHDEERRVTLFNKQFLIKL